LAVEVVAHGLDLSSRPVRLHIDYDIADKDRERFVEAINEMKEIHLRNGAIRPDVFRTQRIQAN
jgi:hypothetical protein